MNPFTMVSAALLARLRNFSSGVPTGADLNGVVSLRNAQATPHEALMMASKESSGALPIKGFEQNGLEDGHAQAAVSQSETEDEEAPLETIDATLAVFESRELSMVIDSYRRKLDRELRILELRYPNPADRPRPPLETDEEKAKMAAVLADATDGVRYATQLLQLVSKEKWSRAKIMASKARLALRSAINAQFEWIELGYYIRLYEEDYDYRMAWRKHTEHIVIRDLNVRRTSELAPMPTRKHDEEVKQRNHELIMLRKKVYNDVERFHKRLETSQAIKSSALTSLQDDLKTKEKHAAVVKIQRYAIKILQLQIKTQQTETRIEGFELLAEARLNLEEVYEVYAEKLSQGHYDKEILSSYEYRRGRQILKLIIEKLKERNDLDWENSSKDDRQKRDHLRHELGSWFQSNEEFLVELQVASKTYKELGASPNADEHIEEDYLPMALAREPCDVVKKLTRMATLEQQRVKDTHEAIAQDKLVKAARELRKAREGQDILQEMRVNRVKAGLPDLNLEAEHPSYASNADKLASKLKREGLNLMETEDTMYGILGAELSVAFSQMIHVNSILGNKRKIQSQAYFSELPQLLKITSQNEIPVFLTEEEELKASRAKVLKGIELLLEVLQHKSYHHLGYAMEVMQMANKAQEEADRLRIHRVLNGLSDEKIREYIESTKVYSYVIEAMEASRAFHRRE